MPVSVLGCRWRTRASCPADTPGCLATTRSTRRWGPVTPSAIRIRFEALCSWWSTAHRSRMKSSTSPRDAPSSGRMVSLSLRTVIAATKLRAESTPSGRLGRLLPESVLRLLRRLLRLRVRLGGSRIGSLRLLGLSRCRCCWCGCGGCIGRRRWSRLRRRGRRGRWRGSRLLRRRRSTRRRVFTCAKRGERKQSESEKFHRVSMSGMPECSNASLLRLQLI
jgi:hypothetical protein